MAPEDPLNGQDASGDEGKEEQDAPSGETEASASGADALAKEKEEHALFQTQILVFAALLLGLMVLAFAEIGYEDERGLPAQFLGPCIFVIAVGGLTAFAETWMAVFWKLFEGLGANGREEPGWVEPLRRWRRRDQPKLVYLLTAVMGYGFSALVWETGLGIESPYIPLVTAPAVFGPFVARKPVTVGALLLFVAAVLAVITFVPNVKPCGDCLDDPIPEVPLQSDTPENLRNFDRALRRTEENRPGREVYLTVGLAFLVIATGISMRRGSRVEKLTQQKLELQAERDGLEKKVKKLEERLGGAGGTGPDEAPPRADPPQDREPS